MTKSKCQLVAALRALIFIRGPGMNGEMDAILHLALGFCHLSFIFCLFTRFYFLLELLFDFGEQVRMQGRGDLIEIARDLRGPLPRLALVHGTSAE
jgi:hypothetical protein